MSPLVQTVQPLVVAKPAKAYYPALTGLRAIAAWLVFFHHFNPFTPDSIAWRVVREWYTGVALFFVLSGLLICARYLNEVKISKAWGMKYLRNRVARIYPMYLLVTCATFAVFQASPAYDLTGVWATQTGIDKTLVFGLNVTFLRGFFDQFKFTGVAAGWTLTVEECFYFTAPLLLLGLRGKPGRLLLYAVGLVGIGALLVRFAPHYFGFFYSFSFLFTVTFFGRCLEFLAGMGLALFILSNTRLWGQFYTWGGLIWMVAVMGLMAWVDNPALPEATTLPMRIFLNNVALVPGVCALFYGLIREQTVVRRLLETKTFDLLGKASYTFYLIHLGILSRFLHFYLTSNVLVMFVITNAVAILLFKLVEEPMHRWIGGHRKKLQKQLV